MVPQLQFAATAPAMIDPLPLPPEPVAVSPPKLAALTPAPDAKLHMERKGAVAKVGKPYQVAGRWYYPKHDPTYQAEGTASWYGPTFHGKHTSNGEVFNMNRLSAAHPTLPLPSYVEVTNLANGRTIVVRVNDRGPYKRGRIIDLSKRAAELLDYTRTGTANVRVRYLKAAPLEPDESFEQRYLAKQSWYRVNVASVAPAAAPSAEAAAGDWTASTSLKVEQPVAAVGEEGPDETDFSTRASSRSDAAKR